MDALSSWLDISPPRRSTAMDVMAGTVTSIYDEANGLVEVHLDGSPDGQTVITQSAAGLTYIGARVRVSRGSDGAATMAHAPAVRAPRGTPTVAVGETGRALQDLAGKYTALVDTSAPVLGWDSGIRSTGYDVPPTYWARLPLFEGGELAACSGFTQDGTAKAYEATVEAPGLYAVSARAHAWSTGWDGPITCGVSVHRSGAAAPSSVWDTHPRADAYAPERQYATPTAYGIVRLGLGDSISILVRNGQTSTVGVWGWAISASLVATSTR